MAIAHVKPREVTQVAPLGKELAAARTTTISVANSFELIRLILPAGKLVPTHSAPGEIIVHCLEGRVAFTAGGTIQQLSAGQLLFMDAGDSHAVEALEASSLLITLVRTKAPPQAKADIIQDT